MQRVHGMYLTYGLIKLAAKVLSQLIRGAAAGINGVQVEPVTVLPNTTYITATDQLEGSKKM